MRGSLIALVVFFAFGATACTTTYSEKVSGARSAFFAGDLETARVLLANQIESVGPDDDTHDLLLLEDSIVQLASGNPAAAEERLRKVRDDFDALEKERLKQVMGEFTSYLTDDRFTVYAGEDYERLLIRVMLAFSNLLGDGGDAIAYSNQILEKQREILEQDSPDRSGRKYKSGYKRVGVGAYLYGVITEASDATGASEARISYKRVQEWEPQFKAIEEDLERVEKGGYSRPGHGIVYVFGFVGRGPVKIEVFEHDLTMASEIALQMMRFIPTFRDYGPTLDLSPLRVPQLIAYPDNGIRGLRISVDGEEHGITQTVTDVTATALQQYAQVRDWILGKAILRRMVKKAITTAAKGTARRVVRKGDHRHGDAAEFGIEVAGIIANTIWSALERADTRHWTLLPDKIQVLRLELPVGEHEISAQPSMTGDTFGRSRSTRIKVVSGNNTYVLAFVPTPYSGPGLLTSRPASSRTTDQATVSRNP